MRSATAQNVQAEHPIDLIEGLATSHEWPFERGTEDDLNLCIAGAHCDYHLAISWRAGNTKIEVVFGAPFKRPFMAGCQPLD